MTAPMLPAGAVAGWGLHPLESAAFARRTPGPDIRQQTSSGMADHHPLTMVRIGALSCVRFKDRRSRLLHMQEEWVVVSRQKQGD
jgi:hypothetical protein